MNNSPSRQDSVQNLAGEEGWVSTSSSSDSSSRSSSDDEENSMELNNLNSEPQSSKKQPRCIVSVQRSDISATTGQEGDEELQNLNVDVYDQQTYEDGVFQQVDNVMSKVDKEDQNRCKQSTSKQTSKLNDFMRVVHAQSDKESDNGDNSPDPTQRDEIVLNLTRMQRLNKTIVKQEPIDTSYSDPQQYKNLPRIPRLNNQNNKTPESRYNKSISNDDIHLRESTSRRYSLKREQISKSEIARQNVEEDISSDESANSEYRPEASEDNLDEDLDDNIDYDTDDELGGEHFAGEEEECRSNERKNLRLRDDGDLNTYRKRIREYSRDKARMRLSNIQEDGTEIIDLDELVQIDGDLYIPKEVWDNLFEHQKTGVRWLWELHQLGTGGILGDEMGLGKTIQMIAFLTAIRSSEIRDTHKGYMSLGPTILVCPATVMHQWLLEFRKWYPQFRVAILHSTGTFCGERKNLVQIINKSNGVLIVSYPGVVIYQDVLHDFDWHYAILDEGHKIRNPDAQVTLACKRFRTPHRIILSGSPVQNNLKELWSIFDFIYPGKLGTLPVFMEQFATPITQGGYSNASDIQVQIAYKCACVLRDTIKPFLLRRTKAEVNSKLKLPDRSEQVLFCKLTEKQRKLYESYLGSPTIRDIKAGFCQIFVGLIQLRKICNHPDLFDATECKKQIKQKEEGPKKQHLEFFSEDETYGHINKSGKMMVVDALLKIWKKQGHKVLLFTQSRQMLKIFMNYLEDLNYKYLYMDGTTSIGSRQSIIEEFNNKEEIFIFLLTTRVGGVGVNLTGANRIIIYDPDWNPSTDIQARERAWRIGQKRHVIIYRLLTAGTIEEKIYHRQVFKLYLTNRILKNAKQKRFFKTNDLHELFTLGDNDKNIETKALFDDDLQINHDTIKKMKRKKKAKRARKEEKKRKRTEERATIDQLNAECVLTEEKRRLMRERAKELSRLIGQQYGSGQQENSNSVRIKIEPGTESYPTPIRIKKEPGLESGNEPHLTDKNINSNPIDTNHIDKKIYFKDIKKEIPTKKHVDYLVKQDIYKPNNLDCDKPSTSHKRKEDYILERLFKSSNISGALKHDKIESDSTEDHKVVESEAEKVARDAIRALRESRSFCLDSTVGIPNWTGRNGQIASKPRLMPKNKGRLKFLTKLGTPSTSSSSSNTFSRDSLLFSIKKRNQNNPIAMNRYSNGALALQPTNHSLDNDDDDAEEERNKDFEGKSEGTGAEKMADKLRDFILFKSARNGESQTDEVLDFFRTNFTPDMTSVFKALLYKMCEFQRRGDKGFWVLKSEFRDI